MGWYDSLVDALDAAAVDAESHPPSELIYHDRDGDVLVIGRWPHSDDRRSTSHTTRHSEMPETRETASTDRWRGGSANRPSPTDQEVQHGADRLHDEAEQPQRLPTPNFPSGTTDEVAQRDGRHNQLGDSTENDRRLLAR